MIDCVAVDRHTGEGSWCNAAVVSLDMRGRGTQHSEVKKGFVRDRKGFA